MKVLFLSELFYPHGGGAELATYLYAKLLSQTGFNVVVVTNRFSGESEVSNSKNLTICRLPLFKGSASVKYSMLRRFDVLFSGFLKKLIKWADAVYIPRSWFSAIPLAKKYGKPVVTHLHDYINICPLAVLFDPTSNVICEKKSVCSSRCIYLHERGKNAKFFKVLGSVTLNFAFFPFLRKLIEWSDAVVCVSGAQRDTIIKAVPSLGPKSHVIYNPLPEVRQIGIKGDDFGYFGGLSYLKGFHTLCHAMMHINAKYYKPINIHATKLLGSAKQLSESLSALHILPYGKLSYDQLEKVYSHIRAVIVPSVWSEPSPYVVLEALLKGRLVIASQVGGIPEQVNGCPGVFLFHSEDHRELAETMLYVKDLSRETVASLGMKNRERVLSRFSNEKTIGEFIQLLNLVSCK